MTTPLRENIELNFYWEGSNTWYDWKISGVTVSLNHCVVSEITARINTQLPSNEKQRLLFSPPSQALAESRKISSVPSSEDKGEKITTLKCSAAAAKLLCLTVNIFYSEKVDPWTQENKDKPYTRSDVIPPKMNLPLFQDGEKYDVILSHEDNKINVNFMKNRADFIFNVLANSIQSMTRQSLSPYLVVLQLEAHIEKLVSQIIKTTPHKEVKALIREFETEQLVILRNPKVFTEEEYQAVFSATQKTLLALQTRLSKDEKYSVILNDNTKKAELENKKSAPNLTGEFIFEALASTFQSMASRSLSPYHVVLELDAQMGQLTSEITQEYSVAEIKKLLIDLRTKPLFIPRNSELHTEEEFDAILSTTQQALVDLRKILPLLEGVEAIKKFYVEKNWAGLFHFLRCKLTIQDDVLEKSQRTSLYLSVCHSAKNDQDPYLLTYAFTQTPDGPEKECDRDMYQNWLAQFNIVLPDSLQENPGLTTQLILNRITYALSEIFYNQPSELRSDYELHANKIINELVDFILSSYSKKEIRSFIKENLDNPIEVEGYHVILNTGIEIFDQLVSKLQVRFATEL